MRRLHFLLLTILVLALYANILPNPFVWDDNIFIIQNQFIRDWRNIPLLFKSQFFAKSPKEGEFKEGGYYRPLVMVLYTVEYLFWRDRPSGYHLVSILLHLLNVFLVYRLLQRLFKDEKISFLGALLFASHPVHTEAISYLPSRGDLLVSFFCLSSLLLFRSPGRWQRFLSLFLFGLALLSKESAAIFPALLLTMTFSDSQKERGKRWFASVPYWGLLFFYMAIRVFLFPFMKNPWAGSDPGVFLRTLSSGKRILSYVALLLFPYPLYLERTAPFQTTLWGFGTFLFILVAAGVVFLGKIFWEKNRSLFFGMAWFFIALAPTLNIVLPIYPPMAEHYLYFPSVGFFAVVSFALYHFFKGVEKKRDKTILMVLGCLVLGFWSLVILSRNRDYSDEVRLFTHTAIQSPQSPLMHNNLGSLYMSRGLVEEAEREFERSLVLNPNQAIVWANLGTIYRQKKEYDKAIQCFMRTLKYEPNEVVTWNKLGIAYAESGGEGAEGAFREAIRRDPAFLDPYCNLGSYYWKRGRFKEALPYWEEGARRDPNNPFLKTWLPLLKEKLSKGK